STALAERLDPEEVHDLMDRCFAILLEEIHRYEGTVNQFTGDGIMALFGAPLALENAPERGLRAALGIQAAVLRYGEELERTRGITFRMRIGVHTGPVVVGKIGDDLRMDYTAVGDTTNLAARLQQAAEPGAVLASDHTVKLVEGRFVTRPIGPLALKGKSQPIAAHEIVRARARIPLVAGRDLTPLVGRSPELATLEALFERAAAGRGQIAFVVGEAGIGKSRIIYELRRRLDDRDMTWLEGRCVSFAREIPLLPITDVVKASFGIEETDGEATIIAKIHDGIERMFPEIAPTEALFRQFLAVDPGDTSVAAMDGQARRFALFDALKRMTLAGAARRPLVVLIEDLHWIDQPSEEYLTYVADALATARVLVLCTYRPGYRSPLAERSYATRIALQPLSAVETGAMAEAVLETQRFPPEIRDIIARKAEGNPFFVEEVAKSLLEMGALRRTEEGLVLNRGLSEIEIPDTIQDVIMARIDRLEEHAKRAIQIASVIGREFAVRLLERVAELGGRFDKLVGDLRSLELIYEKSGVPELAYMFKHALTHDVAYQSLLVQRRKELHRTIGRAVEELYADRLGEYSEVLAHHFYHGEEWEKAFEFLVKAADKAHESFANAEAVYFYERALEAAGHLRISNEARIAIHDGKASAHFAMSEFSQACSDLREA
ncbi:MAG: ATP-binding protein, partial [Candidatus Binatia bacterium]